MKQSRRNFLKRSSASAALGYALLNGITASARALQLPLGLQLYSVRDLLPSDYAGTLKQLGGLGFKEVESAGYYKHSAAEVKQAMDAAGLKLVSAHYSHDDLKRDFDAIVAFHHELGVTNIVCSFPGFKNPERVKGMTYQQLSKAFTLEDWRWNAEEFNHFGEKLKAAGIHFAYHNHTLEFRATEGVTPLEELLRLTDPEKVSLEMDCGWVIVGGADPVAILKKHGKRITMLHVKDFKPAADKNIPDAEPSPVEMGTGTIDYRPIFAEAARSANIRHIFVEQEAFTVPPMDSLKMDAEYMHKLGVG